MRVYPDEGSVKEWHQSTLNPPRDRGNTDGDAFGGDRRSWTLGRT